MNAREVQIMVDIETMSTRSNAAICSIGAVKFTIEDGIVDTFYVTVDPVSCKNLGLHFSKDTVAWWKEQNKEALKELLKNNIPLHDALEAFSDWYGTKSKPTWGNGAAFDNVIIQNAYLVCDKPRPWKYPDDRCYRTMRALVDIPMDPFDGTVHNALHDAIYQTKHLLKILKS